MLACHGTEPSAGGVIEGGEVELASFDRYKGSAEADAGYGYVARIMAINTIWGSNSKSRG